MGEGSIVTGVHPAQVIRKETSLSYFELVNRTSSTVTYDSLYNRKQFDKFIWFEYFSRHVIAVGKDTDRPRIFLGPNYRLSLDIYSNCVYSTIQTRYYIAPQAKVISCLTYVWRGCEARLEPGWCNRTPQILRTF